MTLMAEAASWPAEGIIRWGIANLAPELAVASSFGAEDVVLIDMAARAGGVRVFTLDTDFLFPETYELVETIEERYNITIERCRASLTPAEQAKQLGDALWASRPDLCCNVRKVEPLTAKLGELRGWITGIRRDQAPTRAGAQKVEWDARFGLVKLNPLADWTWADVWSYIHEYDVPYNPLHNTGYPSIGCLHCTRAVAPGEDPRAGRWAGTAKTECGLHVK
jgi:phosphoadenosine phosphosulfate reductase